MATIHIDNQPYQVRAQGRNLLEACLSLGLDVPYFCWHPALRSVGACRQCAVKLFRDEHDARGRIVMSCMTPVSEGMRVSVADPEAAAFRRTVIEWLMVNHPHDCPVCDEGGECHLQDMTVMAGHAYRRYRFSKRTHRDQDLGPFLHHEMNRCIQCYRCLRFYRDYAGGRDFEVHGWHDNVYFGRHQDGPLQSEFSGNLVEVCPTGVFTDKSLRRRYTRKWDLQTAPSVCVHCGLGCNTIPAERYGKLRRVRPRFNARVNGYFMCDRGRYGYEFVNSDLRIRQAMLRGGDGALRQVSPEQALRQAAEWLREGKVIGIGSPRASLESNYALQALVGKERFHHGLPERDLRLVRAAAEMLRAAPAPTPSLREVESADAALVLGEDPTNVAPMLDLALRQAVLQGPRELAGKLGIPEWDDAATRQVIQDRRGPLFVATPLGTKLDDQAAAAFRAGPEDLARLGFAVAHEIDPAAPAAEDLPEPVLALARRVAAALAQARRPVVISGPGCGSESVMQAAANVARALVRRGTAGRLCLALPECNSLGSAMLDGGTIDSALAAVRSGAAEVVILVENDLYRRVDRATADALLQGAKHVLVIDHLANATTAKAAGVLPAATFAESSGTLVNNEGRAQRLFRVFMPDWPIRESWRWLGAMMAVAGKTPSEAWKDLDAVLADLAGAEEAFRKVPSAAPPAGLRLVGQRVPRQPHRYSGRTAMTAHLDVHEPAPPQDADAPLSFSMEGYDGRPPPALVGRFWWPGWNSEQAINKFQIEVGGPLQGGEAGQRLIEPPAGKEAPYFADIPAPLAPNQDQWLIVAAYHIFGSEELSLHSPCIAERAPQPYLGVSAADAKRLGLNEGQPAELTVRQAALEGRTGREWNQTLQLPARIRADLPAGVAALPVGLPGLPVIPLPARGSIGAAGRQAPPPEATA